MTRLYDLSAERRALLEHVAECEGEIDDETAVELDRLGDDIGDKVEAVLAVAREYELQAELLKSEEQRLAKRRKVAENGRARLRRYVRDSLIAAGMDRVEAGTFRATVTKPRVRPDVYDVDALPDGLCEMVRVPDKRAIRAALQDGADVPGARLVEGEYGLRVT